MFSENNDNPIIKSFNNVLEPLIKKYDEQAKSKSSSAQSTPRKNSRKSKQSKSTMNLVIVGFFFSMGVVTGQECAVNHQQNRFGLQGLAPATVVSRLPEFYHFVSNAPLNQVRIWGFGEDHYNLTHYQLLKEFIPAIGKPGDLILIEGRESGVEVSCHSICVGTTPNGGYKRTVESDNCIENLGLEKFRCFGSDVKQVVNKYFALKKEHAKQQTESISYFEQASKALPEIQKIETSLSRIPKLIQEVSDKSTLLTSIKDVYRMLSSLNENFQPSSKIIQPQLTNLEQSIKNYEAGSFLSMVDFMTVSVKLFNEVTHQIMDTQTQFATKLKELEAALQGYSDKIVIGLRNKDGLIKTLELPFVKNHVKNYQGNIFLLWGGGHFFPDPEKPERIPNHDESQHGIREYLDQYPHWMGYPK